MIWRPILFRVVPTGPWSNHTVIVPGPVKWSSLQWRHNGRYGVSNHQHLDCLLNRLFKRRSKKTSKLRISGLWVGNSPVTGEFPAQMASNTENVFIRWRHHGIRVKSAGVLLLSWINFNANMDDYIHYKVWDEITYPFPNFNGCAVEVWERISNFIPHFTDRMITYPAPDDLLPWYWISGMNGSLSSTMKGLNNLRQFNGEKWEKMLNTYIYMYVYIIFSV